MTLFLTFVAAVIVVSYNMEGAYKFGRPNTVWLEWVVAICFDELKSVPIHAFLWWFVVKRCGTLPVTFADEWSDEAVMPAVNDDSHLTEIRKNVAAFLESKPVTYFIIGLVVFYSIFILVNLSIDPYIVDI